VIKNRQKPPRNSWREEWSETVKKSLKIVDSTVADNGWNVLQR
jgi:hypothetical protein